MIYCKYLIFCVIKTAPEKYFFVLTSRAPTQML